jgi:hypothetical protein
MSRSYTPLPHCASIGVLWDCFTFLSRPDSYKNKHWQASSGSSNHLTSEQEFLCPIHPDRVITMNYSVLVNIPYILRHNEDISLCP